MKSLFSHSHSLAYFCVLLPSVLSRCVLDTICSLCPCCILVDSNLAIHSFIFRFSYWSLPGNRWIFFVNHFDLGQNVMLRFTSTKRGGGLLNYNGYQYNKKRARVSWRQRKNLSNDIDAKLDHLLREHANREHSDMNLTTQWGRVIKTKHVKMWTFLCSWPVCVFFSQYFDL